PDRQKKIERSDVLRQSRERDAIDGVEQLRIEIVDPELIEVAENDIRRSLRNDMGPVIERLVVVLLQIFAARLHFDQHAIWPEKIGELLSTFWPRACAFD